MNPWHPFQDRYEVSDYALRGDLRALILRTGNHDRARCYCQHCLKLRRPWTWRIRRIKDEA